MLARVLAAAVVLGTAAWVLRAPTLKAEPVAGGTYSRERLTVAPRFGAPPDSADAARLEIDRQKAARGAAEAHRTPRCTGSCATARPASIRGA